MEQTWKWMGINEHKSQKANKQYGNFVHDTQATGKQDWQMKSRRRTGVGGCIATELYNRERATKRHPFNKHIGNIQFLDFF